MVTYDSLKGAIEKACGQKNAENLTCPRCGRQNMNPVSVRNALSRYADVMVCDECGTDEAMRDFFGSPLPLTEWAAASWGDA